MALARDGCDESPTPTTRRRICAILGRHQHEVLRSQAEPSADAQRAEGASSKRDPSTAIGFPLYRQRLAQLAEARLQTV
jgi:hypothetical protein